MLQITEYNVSLKWGLQK